MDIIDSFIQYNKKPRKPNNPGLLWYKPYECILRCNVISLQKVGIGLGQVSGPWRWFQMKWLSFWLLKCYENKSQLILLALCKIGQNAPIFCFAVFFYLAVAAHFLSVYKEPLIWSWVFLMIMFKNSRHWIFLRLTSIKYEANNNTTTASKTLWECS